MQGMPRTVWAVLLCCHPVANDVGQYINKMPGDTLPFGEVTLRSKITKRSVL